MWQEFAAHGSQKFESIKAVDERLQDLEEALAELCLVISRETGNIEASGIFRARTLRAKPEAGGKSHYECVNQLIHYWYCCAASKFLLNEGYQNLIVRPTGHDNIKQLDDESNDGPYDIEAIHPEIGRIVGEVFCVSEALWRQKIGKTCKKLIKSSAKKRFVFYNIEAKRTYQCKTNEIAIYGISTTLNVELVCSTYSLVKI